MTSYRAVTIAIVAIMAIGIGTPPSAKNRLPIHNIAWYSQHNAARELMLHTCRSDMAMSKDLECLNAEAGGDTERSNRLNKRAWPRS